MRWVLGIGIVCVVAGCPGTAPDVPDAPDAPGQNPGLILTWDAKPVIPGPVTAEESVKDVKLLTENLRVVGDAGPGDPRTQVGLLELDWDDDGVPPAVLFPDAPAGLYSQVVLKLEGDEAYRIRGTADVSGTPVEYTIEDDEGLSIVIGCSVQLQAGEQKTIHVEIDFGDAINSVDFSTLPLVDNRRMLEPGDPQMPAFRTKLMQSFSVQDSGAR